MRSLKGVVADNERAKQAHRAEESVAFSAALRLVSCEVHAERMEQLEVPDGSCVFGLCTHQGCEVCMCTWDAQTAPRIYHKIIVRYTVRCTPPAPHVGNSKCQMEAARRSRRDLPLIVVGFGLLSTFGFAAEAAWRWLLVCLPEPC